MKSSSAENDLQIIERVLDGDRDAYGILMERHRQHVFSIVSNRVPPPRVEEVAHEVFVRAYRSLGRYQGRSPFQNWLAGVAVRTCQDFWRERYRSKETAMSTLSEEHRAWIDRTSTATSEIDHRSAEAGETARELLSVALEKLGPEDRSVVELVHLDERPVREAADILGWSQGKVKIRAFRARKKLRSIIEKLLDDERRVI